MRVILLPSPFYRHRSDKKVEKQKTEILYIFQ